MEIGMEDLGVNACSLFVMRSSTKALKCYRALKFEKTDYPTEHSYYNSIDFMIRKNKKREITD
jgi:hypothetical protein